ncbi:ATP-binding protein [Phenylobacterium sp.]|uniref:ATP-binding protein n=1 Tax=Phenylobacterium sp. TaxID=1871053 RepID=UPI00271BE4BB|nr:ATP-binding protein [Phenylobacterium sp.]MDO8802222.1 ATP-binding protein [Phenylobacterium sp.]
MALLDKLQIRWSLIPAIAAIGAILLVLSGLAIGVYDEQTYRAQKVREATAQGEILAATVTAALAFDDRPAAQEYVEALRVNSQVVSAGVYNEAGALVADYARDPGRHADPTVALHPPAFVGSHLVVVTPVSEAGQRLGLVALRIDTDPIARRLSRYVGLGLLLVMALLVVGVLAAAHAVLTRTNSDLADANRNLQEEMHERERAESALRQSQRMEAMGQLTGGVAHDFNNILMIASSGLDLMERTDKPERRKMLIDGMRQAVDRGASLTRQLLAFSRRTSLRPEVIDVTAQLEGMRLLLDRSLGEDISVIVDLPPDLWRVHVDPSEFELAILNLAVNARDAMPGGGAITISGSNRPAGSDATLPGDHLVLRVADTGSGMTPETLSRVFEPFFTTKAVGKGTGLGLSQVYGFSRASGGDVRIQSEVGRGSTILLLLPRTEEPLPLVTPDPSPVTRPPGAQGDLLLVEDDEGVATLVSGMLTELGYNVTRVDCAAGAVAALEANPAFDIVFSDLVMPGEMDGIALAREIGRRWPSLPVLLTTGFSPGVAAAAAEGLTLLTKPYGIGALAAALDAARPN